MFVIKDKQMEAFKEIEMEKFYVKSILFLEKNFPKWTDNNNDEEKWTFINSCIDFGNQFGIKKEINIQKLMALELTYRLFEIEDVTLDKLLNFKFIPEDIKIEKLWDTLNKKFRTVN